MVTHILLKAQKVPNINIQKVLPSETTKLKCPGLLITSDRWWETCCILMGLDYCYFFFSILLFIYGYAGRRRQWHPTPVLLPGKSHGQRSLLGCSPWGRQESDTTEQLHCHFSLSCTGEGNGNPL